MKSINKNSGNLAALLLILCVLQAKADESSGPSGPFSGRIGGENKAQPTYNSPFKQSSSDPFVSGTPNTQVRSAEHPVVTTYLPLHVYVTACLDKAALLVEDGKFNLANVALNQAANKTTRSAEVHYIRGLCAQAKSEFERAKKEFQLAQNTDDRLLIGKAQAGYDFSTNKQSMIVDEELSFPSVPEILPASEDF